MACTPSVLSSKAFGASTSSTFSFNHGASAPPITKRNNGRGVITSRASTFSAAAESLRLELDENPAGIISGEWPENFSLLGYEDLRIYFESQDDIAGDDQPRSRVALLGRVMSRPVWTATAEQTLEEIDHHFEFVSGLPVVDGQFRCVGVVSKKDIKRASHGLRTTVGEMMSSPAITLPVDKTIMDAAALMLKTKIHRIPIVNEERQVVGIITRNDVLRELEAVL